MLIHRIGMGPPPVIHWRSALMEYHPARLRCRSSGLSQNRTLPSVITLGVSANQPRPARRSAAFRA